MNKQPDNCPICGQFLTLSEIYVGRRCLNPGHWQAAGGLIPTDYYAKARVAARALAEPNRRFLSPDRKQYRLMD